MSTECVLVCTCWDWDEWVNWRGISLGLSGIVSSRNAARLASKNSCVVEAAGEG